MGCPGAAARRVRQRAVLEVLSRGYDGATSSRLNGNWRSSGTSADAEIGSAGARLRNRMRELVRNNPHAANAVTQLVTHIVGDGIMPRAKTGDDAKDKKVNDLLTNGRRKPTRTAGLISMGFKRSLFAG